MRRWTGQRDGEAWVPRAPVREGEKERQERQARGSALGGVGGDRESDRRGRVWLWWVGSLLDLVVAVAVAVAVALAQCCPPNGVCSQRQVQIKGLGLLPAGARWTRLALTDDWIGPGLDHHHYFYQKEDSFGHPSPVSDAAKLPKI